MLAKPMLFMSSYAPLFALLAIRFEQRWLWIPCAGLAILGTASLWLLLRLDTRAAAAPHDLVAVREAGGEAAAYLGSYLLPFLTVATPGARDVAAYIGFLAVAAAIYLHSSLIQVNPLLYLLGYHVVSVTDGGGLRAYLIARNNVTVGSRILATRFGTDVLVARGVLAADARHTPLRRTPLHCFREEITLAR
jgi:hypothetical protein